MNKKQRLAIVLFCFILGGALICGAYIGADLIVVPGTEVGARIMEQWRTRLLFKDIKLYLGIISIGIGCFFLFKGTEHE